MHCNTNTAAYVKLRTKFQALANIGANDSHCWVKWG